MYAIELQQIDKVFRSEGGVARVGLRDVSAQVRHGERVVLIGGNGSGKSTLLRVIAGFVSADRGEIFLDGTRVTDLAPHRRSTTVALVDQDPARSCATDLSVAESVALALHRPAIRGMLPLLSGARAAQMREMVAEHSVRLSMLWKARVGDLSGGERQMLAMIIALIRGCAVFLLDEHTAALDVGNRGQVWNLTEKLTDEQQKTVVVVTHDFTHAMQLDGRLIVMSAGAIVLDVAATDRRDVSEEHIVQLYMGGGREVRLP